MLLVSDYKLDTIYITSGSSAFSNYLQPWLFFSIGEFETVCNQSLDYNAITQTFTETIAQQNKLVLAKLMIRYWLQKEVQDVLQMRLHVQDKDFKTFAEANNLREKQKLYNDKREELSQELMDYELKYNNWSNWKLQNFD
jgi:hypothetical protein